MCFEIQIELDRVDTCNFITFGSAMKYPFIIGNNQPGIGTHFIFAEMKSSEHFFRWQLF